MNHWHKGDQEPMPGFLSGLHRVATEGGGNMEVNIRPGAGSYYEERFSFYWLVVAWSILAFNVASMVILLVHMGWGGTTYAMLPHLAGTAIINCIGVGMPALIYRFVLFPAPGYYTRLLPEMPMAREDTSRYTNGTHPFGGGAGGVTTERSSVAA